MARKKSKGTELSVFKGREARLNRAIFQTLGLKGFLTIYQTHKEIKGLKGFGNTKYTNVNRRMRALERIKFIEKKEKIKNKVGFELWLYGLTFRAYASLILNQTDLNQFLENAQEVEVLEFLTSLASFSSSDIS